MHWSYEVGHLLPRKYLIANKHMICIQSIQNNHMEGKVTFHEIYFHLSENYNNLIYLLVKNTYYLPDYLQGKYSMMVTQAH